MNLGGRGGFTCCVLGCFSNSNRDIVATPFWLLYFPFHSLRVLIILYMLSPSFSTRTHLPHITLASKYVIASCLLLHLLSCLNTPFLFKHRFCYLNNICHSGGKAYFLSRYCKKFSCDFQTKRSELLFCSNSILVTLFSISFITRAYYFIHVVAIIFHTHAPPSHHASIKVRHSILSPVTSIVMP